MFKQIHFATSQRKGLTQNMFRFNAISFRGEWRFNETAEVCWTNTTRGHISRSHNAGSAEPTGSPTTDQLKIPTKRRFPTVRIRFIFCTSEVAHFVQNAGKVSILLNFCWWFKDGTKGMSKQKHPCKEHLKFFKTLNSKQTLDHSRNEDTARHARLIWKIWVHDPTSL